MANNPYTPSAASLKEGSAVAGPGFRDLSGITASLSVLLALGAAVSVYNIIAAALGLVWQQGAAPNSVLGPVAGLVAVAAALMVLLQELLYLTTMIIFGRWIYLAHKNLPEMGARYLRIGPAWAVGSFFVPFINLFVPLRGMCDLAKASRNPGRWHLENAPLSIVAWWPLWLLSSLLYSISTPMSGDAPVDPQVAGLVRVLHGMLSLPLYLLARLIVRRIWRDQAQRMQPAAVAV